MTASTTLVASVAPVDTRVVGSRNNKGGTYLKIGAVAARLGVSGQTVRNYLADGTLTGKVLPTGHRLVSLASVCEFEGEPLQEKEDGQGGLGIAAYIRVSSQNQAGAGSLDRQRERLLGTIADREGLKKDDMQTYEDIASSFGDRPSLNRLITAVIAGKVKTIYVEHFNRLSRVPALTRLVEYLCREYGVTIIALDREDDTDPSAQLADYAELVDFVTVLGCRAAAKKSRMVTQRSVAPEWIERILALRAMNLDLREVHRRLKAEGAIMSRRDGKTFPISYNKVCKILDANGVETAVSAVVTGEATRATDFFAAWVSACTEKREGSKLAIRILYANYSDYCREHGVEPKSDRRFGRLLTTELGLEKTRKGGNNLRFAVGLALRA